MIGPVNMQAVAQIRDKVRMVKLDPADFGVLSTGGKCAVALVLNDIKLMRWLGTALDCVDRLEGDWISAAIYVQGNGLIVGHDAEGESVSAATPLSVVWPRVSFLSGIVTGESQ